jgi:hypothetical protein
MVTQRVWYGGSRCDWLPENPSRAVNRIVIIDLVGLAGSVSRYPGRGHMDVPLRSAPSSEGEVGWYRGFDISRP